jgi:hypothetical protein
VLKNFLLLFVSVFLTYSVFDFILFRDYLMLVPQRLHEHLGKLRFLAQPSKTGVIPQDYVLILGDSYAQGAGDWVAEVGAEGNAPFHAAHVLHQMTGQDVMTFGMGGADSTFGYVIQPVRTMTGMNITAQYKVSPPKEILAYFFEGNDIEDNVTVLRYDFAKQKDLGRLYEPGYYRAFLEERVAADVRSIQRGWYPWKNAFLLDFGFNLFRYNLKAIRSGGFTLGKPPAYKEAYPAAPLVEYTKMVAGGKVQGFAETTAPPLFHTEDEMRMGAFVFAESIAFLRRQFPESEIRVIYIPHPLNSYRIVSETIGAVGRTRDLKQEVRGGVEHFPASFARARSDDICARILAGAKAAKVGFVDVRPYFWDGSAQRGTLHGPWDWGHLNKLGYTILAEAIIESRTNPKASMGCANATTQALPNRNSSPAP